MINIYNRIQSSRVLGPYQRYILWVQGCPFSCVGCMTPDSQDMSAGTKVSIQSLVNEILYIHNNEGITITGGEPFMQAKELVIMIEKVKFYRDLGVIIYSGFTLEQLKNKNDKNINRLLDLTDILIDGLYEDSLNDNTRALVGSTNQKIHRLTSRYDDVMNEYYNNHRRDIEIHLNDNNMMIVGIPKRDTLNDFLKPMIQQELNEEEKN